MLERHLLRILVIKKCLLRQSLQLATIKEQTEEEEEGTEKFHFFKQRMSDEDRKDGDDQLIRLLISISTSRSVTPSKDASHPSTGLTTGLNE